MSTAAALHTVMVHSVAQFLETLGMNMFPIQMSLDLPPCFRRLTPKPTSPVPRSLFTLSYACP